MKFKITKEEFDALHDLFKAEYEEQNGSYFQKVPDKEEAIGAIKKAKDNESASHAETKVKLKKFEDELAAKEADRLRSSGDVKALEDSWNAKYEARESELLNEIGTFKKITLGASRESLLSDFTSRIGKAENQSLFKKCISDRIETEIVEGKAVHRILDKDGKPSAMTMEDFEKELRKDRAYDSFIVASKASGNGVPEVINRVGGANPEKPLSQLSSKELAAHVKQLKGE